jgi:hypothetical protein
MLNSREVALGVELVVEHWLRLSPAGVRHRARHRLSCLAFGADDARRNLRRQRLTYGRAGSGCPEVEHSAPIGGSCRSVDVLLLDVKAV